MKVYKGDRTIDGVVVTVNDEPLPQRLDVKALSDDGFEWSFEGPASAQLSLAILVDHLGDEEKALRLYEPFMEEVVANFSNEWVLTSDDIDEAIDALSEGTS
ncbi:DUF6166 domain-containing protein [Dichotomicrobium thermohalophilum]|uniref:Uncharacterized protein n=1 Tax=Dichotomicrobium thermohalophilum TaxID=933063 RepID=A0A397PK69_9HYPH|nr:DUF6166 domain-containing protein [Dichotomicrobium thermohalophilum]RIA47665.1 hypothetical protein BXY53_2227 [Dichotomicrobium thermohalophilum]